MTTTMYEVGDYVRLEASFVNSASPPVAADPVAIALVIKEPDGTLITKAIGDLTNPAAGSYRYDHTIAKAGRHTVRWTATGNSVTDGQVDEFYARRAEGQ